MPSRVPGAAWAAVAAGVVVNLCLGVLYAWSVWKSALTAGVAGTPMAGTNAGWTFLSESQATLAYAVCGFTFALTMIPGGRLQDRKGPRAGATVGGAFLALGCVVAGLSQNFLGLVVGFGLLGGIGMGFGYAAATPAAVKWFGRERRGLVVGVVVAGYGAAAIYIAPLASHLIAAFGLTNSFTILGGLFGVAILTASVFLKAPPPGYVAPTTLPTATAATPTARDYTTREMLGTWQYYALVLLFVGSAQSGLLVIANAAPILKQAGADVAVLAANAWILASFGGRVNAGGRVGTGSYSDRVGRANAYTLNGLVAALCVVATPAVIEARNVPLLFLVVGVAFWQYGGGLSLLPAFTADFFGPKNLGTNYGFVFLGWGLAFFGPQFAAELKLATGNAALPFYVSAAVLVAAVAVSRLVRRPAAGLPATVPA
jgi:OFA family oxalate/formate antiporter-like MFS transporter